MRMLVYVVKDMMLNQQSYVHLYNGRTDNADDVLVVSLISFMLFLNKLITVLDILLFTYNPSEFESDVFI